MGWRQISSLRRPGGVLRVFAVASVVVRVRPLSNAEKEKRHFQCVFQLDKQRLLLVDPEKYENNILRQNRQHERQFSFDAAFGPNSSQEIYNEVIRDLLSPSGGVLDLMEDEKGNIRVPGLSTVRAPNLTRIRV
ncbi:unnamed protein product [Strongylus vulgaris]|uniref:Kinesin motor domain-containing protein n=1 Tax=Strongylus vulgaris TaxID=40348 RepID=A0A3P7INT3_STRVU|nr:unnamed protein product [Strongylus vulgaris]